MLKITVKAKYNEYNKPENYRENDLTQRVEGVFSVDVVKNFNPSGHEKRDWNYLYGDKFFGLYPESRWKEFLEDIKANGVKEPIMIYVEKDGRILIGEGSHRIEACLQTGVKDIPVDIRYFGGSETHVGYFDKYITEDISEQNRLRFISKESQ